MIKVTAYERENCNPCKRMREQFELWLIKNPDEKVKTTFLEAEDHLEFLKKKGFMVAPVYHVERDGTETWIVDFNPDILVDALEGNDSVWD